MGESVIIEAVWTEHLKDKDSDSGQDDETVATSSDCTTGSINSSTASGIVGTTGERLLEVEDPKGYLRPTISSASKSVGKSQRSSAGRSPRATVDFTDTTTATSGRRHSLDTCKNCLF